MTRACGSRSIDRDVPSYFRSLEHLLRYCARPPFALERLSVSRGADGQITRIRYVLPRHKAANWVGPGRSSRGSRVAHQPEDRGGGAIDRAILWMLHFIHSPPKGLSNVCRQQGNIDLEVNRHFMDHLATEPFLAL